MVAGPLAAHLNRTGSVPLGRWWTVLMAVVTPTALGVVLVRELTTDLGTPYEGYPTWMLAVFGWGMAAVVLVLGVLTVFVRWRPETSLSPPEDVADDEEVTP